MAELAKALFANQKDADSVLTDRLLKDKDYLMAVYEEHKEDGKYLQWIEQYQSHAISDVEKAEIHRSFPRGYSTWHSYFSW